MLGQTVHLLEMPVLVCIFLGFWVFSVVASQIPLGSKLFAAGNDYWVSPNGDFAFGFFNHSDQPNLYSAGIRFNSNSIPINKRTMVWVAGGDVSVGCHSYLQLTHTGDLVLFDSSKGITVWTSNTSHFSVSSAFLLDNGNLILQNGDQYVIWQSFGTPSDTLIPGQNLYVGQTLRAASRNSVSSYYSLSMDVSGELKLKWESNVNYWTGGSPFVSAIQATLTSGGALQLLDRKSRPVWSLFGEDHNDSSVSFRFLRLDIDGNLRMYSWIEASGSWRSVWQAVQNHCDVFATCGLYGVCVFTAAGITDCKCPFGSGADFNSKCLAPYKQKCESGTTMLMLEHTFLYGIYPPNDTVTKTSLEQCRNSCLENPQCTSVTIVNDGTARCLVKQTRYITGYVHPSVMSISFVKVCLDPVAVLPKHLPATLPSSPPSLLRRSHRLCIPCLVGAAMGTLTAFIIIQFGIVLCIHKRRKSIKKTTTLAYMYPDSRGLIILSYTEIKDLTGNFQHRLGAKMFKGVLPNNQSVAIKDLKAAVSEKQFRRAVSVISSIHHKNLVKLEGYCCESGQKFLVYEFAKNGSVDKWMEEASLNKSLTWKKRMEICIGVARAMSYLHTGCREFVSHGNLKWTNVVLDVDLEAKVTEFGLRMLCNGVSSGSGAAEDVASFGEMVVILVSGRRGVEDVSGWAYKEWAEGRAKTVVDARIEDVVDPEEVERALRIAFWCVQVDERLRPSMGEVARVLEGTLTVDPPPPPFFCQRLPEEELLESDPEP
ncbi:PREDICTED: G-type lectin S-receptor-like serine/threonine-protein kinase SD3-1 [Nelumbo nucifera]|uniref:Receptor-like serine/threonine-protein kinase n=2 Tax=Nelumbo nucifera TaxID=4432 RepID=A0A1U7ZY31_NELNU|nr:PREDICTED: G-type lectin S-receptor-like serine/threonine-protein kinase SD3-1 [Nelumbo nucifera]XP_010257223.1 PREDICTED: G-type lectin S-receptor-like serine/threonine-protein kinase SD3-1 [Nelumbo nucifera]XP_010257224.1 PREDICTED: G-type lectin S-receptor-like serine/threonine-protein kinase SD3-1 [Nelumbo nucifera]DAD42358.1 TPA_asm: hypothetical protein HUJ06_000588 [Nelumbo nucifera]